jgi:hypothetical protein
VKRLTIGLLLLLPALTFAQRTNVSGEFRGRNNNRWRVEDKESVQRTFSLTGSEPKRLLVDNVSGFVHVTGYAGSQVQISVAKHIGAVNDTAMGEAKREVKLDMNQQGNFVRLYVDGPFRTQNGVNYRGDDYYGYHVIFDFEIQVPFDTELVLKTINAGNIEVKKTTGEFTVNGVNGGIDMQEVSGSGTVRTVNGPVKVSFTKNPAKACEFKSVNGNLDVYFQPGLNADFAFQTLNGGIYTDFDVATRPTQGSTQNIDGKFLYRVDRRNMTARTGSGGPELKFDTLNGSIRLRSKGI